MSNLTDQPSAGDGSNRDGPSGDYAIIVIGTSAGGVQTLIKLLGELPADLPAALFVVQHVYAYSQSSLATLLDNACPLPVHPARNLQTIERSHVYVARPNYHLLLEEPGRITLSMGPRENLHRPAIDPLFRTAARTYGSKVIGVILSGTLDDGVAGLMAVKMRGGCAVVQAPADAAYSELPQYALDQVQGIDHVVSVANMPELLVHLAEERAGQGALQDTRQPDRVEPQAAFNHSSVEPVLNPEHEGHITGYICPECGGALVEVEEGETKRFICRVGHAFSPRTLFAAQAVSVEEALWTALRSLREQAALAERMAERASLQPEPNAYRTSAEEYRLQAQQSREHAQVIQQILAKLVNDLD